MMVEIPRTKTGQRDRRDMIRSSDVIAVCRRFGKIVGEERRFFVLHLNGGRDSTSSGIGQFDLDSDTWRLAVKDVSGWGVHLLPVDLTSDAVTRANVDPNKIGLVERNVKDGGCIIRIRGSSNLRSRFWCVRSVEDLLSVLPDSGRSLVKLDIIDPGSLESHEAWYDHRSISGIRSMDGCEIIQIRVDVMRGVPEWNRVESVDVEDVIERIEVVRRCSIEG